MDVVDTSGETVEQIELPGAELTNVAFGGEVNRTLVVTDVATASVNSFALSVAGQPLRHDRSDASA
ncbi:MAG: hypothetical protein AB7G88_08870 [Thermomicrobiales bacterium]